MGCKDILESENKEQLIQYLNSCKSIVSIVTISRKSEKYSNFIIKCTDFLPSGSSIYYRLMLLYNKVYTYDAIPRCKYCNKILEDKDLLKYFKHKNVFCSAECYYAYPTSDSAINNLKIAQKKRWDNTPVEIKKTIYDKVKQTNLAKYGTTCTLNTSVNIKKKKDTWIKKYGVDNPLKCEKIKQQVNKTNIERYGSVCPLNNEKIREKAKQTLFNNYGVYNVAQSDVIKNKIRQNCLERYNVDWHSKRQDVWIKQCLTLDKQIKPNYKKYKRYTLPSGKEITVQGYEDVALDVYILNLYNELDIENSIVFMNSLNIQYTIDNTPHRYIPDFYIKSKNLLIEVKSEFTFYKDLEINYKKVEAAINKGFDIIILVFSHVDRKKLQAKYTLFTYEDIKTEKEKYYQQDY